MYLFGTRLTDHFDNLARRGAAYDRVIDDNDPLPAEKFAHRIELDLNTKVADSLGRLYECSADIVVTNQTELERDTGLLRVPHGGRHA